MPSTTRNSAVMETPSPLPILSDQLRPPEASIELTNSSSFHLLSSSTEKQDSTLQYTTRPTIIIYPTGTILLKQVCSSGKHDVKRRRKRYYMLFWAWKCIALAAAAVAPMGLFAAWMHQNNIETWHGLRIEETFFVWFSTSSKEEQLIMGTKRPVDQTRP